VKSRKKGGVYSICDALVPGEIFWVLLPNTGLDYKPKDRVGYLVIENNDLKIGS